MASERLNLTIHLERTGDQLLASYYDLKLRRLGDRVQVPWASIGSEFSYGHNGATLRGLDGITKALDAGELPTLLERFTQESLVDVGHVFFRALLGSSEQWEPVLRALFDDHGELRPNPPRNAVRVRIYTDADELVDLPWRLTAWKGKFLADSGWTFELASDLPYGPDVELDTPCPVLVIAPRFPGMADIDTDRHVTSLRAALPEPFQSAAMFRVVRTRTEIRDAVRGMYPRVVYYYGHAEIRGGQVCLLLGDDAGGPDAINAADLKQLIGEHNPLMAYINACKSGAAGWQSMGYQLAPEVPLIIGNPTTVWSVHAGQTAIQWLGQCLIEGSDPVVAAHEVDREVSRRGFEWGMRTIHANYGRWRARPLAHAGPIQPIGLRLDRDRSRERAYTEVASLVRSEDQRVLSLVSYASVGNLIELSWQQLRDHLEDNASHFVHITWRDVRFPIERGDLRSELFRELAASLGAAPREPIEYALRRVARPVDVPGATPLLWLNWGVFGRRHDQLLAVADLNGWVEFCSELAQRCPPDVRLIGYIALETDRAPHRVLEQAVADLALEHVGDPAFACELIPPLPDVTMLQIAKFLTDKNNCLCPPGLIREAARRLFARTQGKYEATVELIRRAERDGWHTVLHELRPPEDNTPDQPLL